MKFLKDRTSWTTNQTEFSWNSDLSLVLYKVSFRRRSFVIVPGLRVTEMVELKHVGWQFANVRERSWHPFQKVIKILSRAQVSEL